jgi:hypothetical protein
LYDNDYHYTHFTGFILEEEIVATLWSSTRFNIIGDTKHFRPKHFCLTSTRNFGERVWK